MANQKQLDILKSGVENWNRWRGENPDEQIDLSGVDLRQDNLCGINLNRTDLSIADLMGADLSNAKLISADLSEAKLSWADLSNAKLIGAKPIKANLSGANLSGADLSWANLSGANLSGADISGAKLKEANLSNADLSSAKLIGADLMNTKFNKVYIGSTTFSNIDLSNVIGLGSCIHFRNSYIDYHTLKKSKYLPLSFLRGCGLEEAFIKSIPSLIEKGEQFYNCFLSYSSKDHAFVNKLYNDLQDKGIRVWFAPEDMKIAAKIRPALHEAIEQHSKLLIVLSKNSMKSAWVEDEVEKAFEMERTRKETVLFPIRLDDTIFETKAGWANSIKNTRNIGDFIRWTDEKEYKRSFDKLVESLRIEADK